MAARAREKGNNDKLEADALRLAEDTAIEIIDLITNNQSFVDAAYEVKYKKDEKEQEWKDFRNALDKSERKSFDELWDISKLYISSCPNSCQLVSLHPITISILVIITELKKHFRGGKYEEIYQVDNFHDHVVNTLKIIYILLLKD